MIKTAMTLFVLVSLLVTVLTLDEYFIAVQDRELKESDWVQYCTPPGPNEIVPSIGLYNNTHSFNLLTCTWHLTEHGAPGLIDSLYTSFVEPHIFHLKELISQKEFQPFHNAEFQFLLPYAYASCSASPCFDSFGKSYEKRTEKSIMESYGNVFEYHFGDWEIAHRNWDNEDEALEYPAIICTAFVVDGFTHYRMFKWIDDYTISNFEDYRDDSLCDKWFPLIDDGIKVTWDKEHYESDDKGIVTIIDRAMNLNNGNIDFFRIHVYSDIDKTGIQLDVVETDKNSGIFKGTAFFTITDDSSGARLFVEDSVTAQHNRNHDSARIIYGPPINGFVISDDKGNVKHYPITELDKMPCEDFMSVYIPEMLRTEQRNIIGEKLDSCSEQSDSNFVSITNTPITPNVEKSEFPLLVIIPIVIVLSVLVVYWKKRK